MDRQPQAIFRGLAPAVEGALPCAACRLFMLPALCPVDGSGPVPTPAYCFGAFAEVAFEGRGEIGGMGIARETGRFCNGGTGIAQGLIGRVQAALP